MKKFFFFFLSFLFLFGNEQNQTLINWNQYLKKQFLNFDTYKKKENDFFNKRYIDLFNAYKRELEKKWGKYSELPSGTSYVKYLNNIKEKIDFKERKIELVIKVNKNGELKKDILKGIDDITSISPKSELIKNPLLKSIVNDKNIKGMNISSKPIINKSFIDFKKIQIKKEAKNTYIVRINIPRKYYLKKAKEYKNYVNKMSKKFNIPNYVIYSIIEIESAYNPLAISPVPAYGLMQIVPYTAGKDVLSSIYHKEYTPSSTLLFNPKYNIFIGTGYLSKLYYVYFSGVKNPLSRLYLTIAAYNTGPGNVAYAFTSKKNINLAVHKINTMNDNEVYETLIKNLPYKETIRYLKKARIKIIEYKNAFDQKMI